MCLSLKGMRHKFYGNPQSLSILTHLWKNLSKDFMTGLLILADWKRNIYNIILVTLNWLTKMVYYKLIETIIDRPRLTEVIIDVVVWHHDLLDEIVTYSGLLFISKLLSLLYYFLGIKRCISTIFYSQTDNQTK